MSETAVFDTTEALKAHIGDVVGGANKVHVGPPIRTEMGESRVSLFLFHLQVNSALRNELHLDTPPMSGAATGSVSKRDVLPLDLRFLITVFRDAGPSSTTPNELTTLGQIIHILHAEPTLPMSTTGGQTVRLTPEPYPMEEISRIWGLFPQDIYRPSIVYLASPVIVDAGELQAGPPVVQRKQRSGVINNQEVTAP